MHDAPRSILIIDDDERFSERLGRALRERGLAVQTAADQRTALDIASKGGLDLTTLDLRLPSVSGLDLLVELKKVSPDTRVIVVTGYGSIATAIEAMKRGAHHYVTKPVDADELMLTFAKGLVPMSAAAAVPSLARVEWEHINRVLADCEGNISKAARMLRIERRSLQRKLAKFPVNDPS